MIFVLYYLEIKSSEDILNFKDDIIEHKLKKIKFGLKNNKFNERKC